MHFVVEQISGAVSSCKTEYLYPLNNNSPFLPLPRPSQSHSTSCFQESNLDTSYEWIHSICLLVTGILLVFSLFIHVAACTSTGFTSNLRLNTIL